MRSSVRSPPLNRVCGPLNETAASIHERREFGW
jgi:hypothetical protein